MAQRFDRVLINNPLVLGLLQRRRPFLPPINTGNAALRRRFADWLERYAHWPLLGTLVVLIAFHVARSLDFSRDQSEGAMMMVTEQLAKELPGPRWIVQPPYIVTPYGPGYFAVAALIHTLLPSIPPLVTGRILSLVAAVVTATLIGVLVARRTHDARPGLVSAIVCLGYPGIAYWAHDYRVDALATLFGIAAYAAADGSTAGLIWSALFVVCGSLVKQTVAFATIPVTLHLLLNKRPRAAWLYLLFVAGAGAVVWAAAVALSDGYYLSVALEGNRRGYFLERITRTTLPFVSNPVTIAGALTIVMASLTDARRVIHCRFVAALIVSGAIGMTVSGIEGSADNYFLECAALVAFVLGLWAAAPLWKRHARWIGSVCWAAAFLLSAALIVRIVASVTGPPPPDFRPLREALSSRVVLADAEYVAAALRSGLQPIVNDPFFYRIAVTNAAVDAKYLVDDLRQGRVSALILFAPLGMGDDGEWPPAVGAVLRSHFQRTRDIAGAAVYRYAPPKELVRASGQF